MAGRYGETIDFLIDDLRTRPGDRIVLVDYYGVLPRDLAPLLTWPAQAAFLIPTQDFRRNALTHRYGDPDRARANWGDLDPATVLETRLKRDALWDAEVTQQAHALNLPVFTTSEENPPASIVEQLSERFRLSPKTTD